MFDTPTYFAFLALVLVPPLVALAVLARRRLTRTFVAGTALVTAIGFVYTVPWDNALIARGVWWYGDDAVLATLYRAPLEEYLFILLQPLLTALWLVVLRERLSGARPGGDAYEAERSWVAVSTRARIGGAVAGLLVGASGLVFLTGERTLYLGAILAWAGPVLALQWGFGWQELVRTRRLTALAVLVPTVYLSVADRVAIELGIWVLSPRFTTGVTVAGLPVEEGLFFLVTNVFVVQGLVLFLWVVERPEPVDESVPDATPASP
ncbi:lycopene cyclase domain-containing protein [Haloarchaeobius sp. TZWWS8]|uniref:lycopene cyclase domain-containing protein n=1 Tax=Haloarchaeobius sp. TZWWS8 TaxID=3446121 RepID=UPI003EBAEA7E